MDPTCKHFFEQYLAIVILTTEAQDVSQFVTERIKTLKSLLLQLSAAPRSGDGSLRNQTATSRCKEPVMAVTPRLVRILVVDDFEPFRRFVCSTLRKRQNLLVIDQASDGLEAVHKAAELLPDLILLDIGLPTLNGLEAARRIYKLVPDSNIVFLSMEDSAEVVQEALSLGALGYVVKTHGESELLAAVERFVRADSSSLSRSNPALTSKKRTSAMSASKAM